MQRWPLNNMGAVVRSLLLLSLFHHFHLMKMDYVVDRCGCGPSVTWEQLFVASSDVVHFQCYFCFIYYIDLCLSLIRVCPFCLIAAVVRRFIRRCAFYLCCSSFVLTLFVCLFVWRCFWPFLLNFFIYHLISDFDLDNIISIYAPNKHVVCFIVLVSCVQRPLGRNFHFIGTIKINC